MSKRLSDLLSKAEMAVVLVLVLLMGIVVILATLELGLIIVTDIFSPPIVVLELDELLEIFGFFLLVLIGLELVETIKVYLEDKAIRVEIVVLVGLIAIARKVITLDAKEMPSLTWLGIAAVLLALALTYRLIRQTPSNRDHQQ